MVDEVKIKVTADTSDFDKSAEKSEKGVQKLSSSIKSLAGPIAIAAAAVVGIGAAIKGAVSVAAKFEDIGVQFRVLTGSVEDANVALNQLQEFAAGTPFQFEEVAAAGKTFLAFGFQASELTGLLKDVGDVAAATGNGLNEIALIYGQVEAAGKLTGERLLQLQERGINVGPALAEALGKPEKALRGLIAKGEVTDEVFKKAFATLSQEGGIAFGGLELKSQTLSGKLSTMSDNWDLLASVIGNVFLPVVKYAVDGITDLIKGFNDLLTTTPDESIISLKKRISELNQEIKSVEGRDKSTFDKIFGNAALEAELLKKAKDELAALNKELQEVEQTAVSSDAATNAMAEKSAAEKRFLLERGNSLDSFREEQAIKDSDNAQQQLEALENNILLEAELKNLAKADELAAKGQFLEASAALEKNATDKQKKELQARSKYEQVFAQQRIGIANQTATLITTIFGEQNKAAFLIAKGAALAQAFVDKGKADIGSLAASRTLPPALSEAYLTKALSLNNVQFGLSATTIGASAIKGFEKGGVIGSSGGVRTGGDNMLFKGREGEVVLTGEDQSELLEGIRGGDLGGGSNVNITIDAGIFTDAFETEIVTRNREGRTPIAVN